MAGKFFGVVVPFLNLLGVRGERFEPGSTALVLEARPELNNHYGQMHGGAIATMLDVAMASAGRSLHPQGVVTVAMTMQFLRPGSGTLSAQGRVRQSGRSLVFCEAEVLDEQGRTVATGTGTFKVASAAQA